MLNIEKFIQNANTKHHNKFDYSLVKLIDWKTNVDVICQTHGIFSISPSTHISKTRPKYGGCPSCSNLKRYTSSEFILRANRQHNNKYDYSLIEFKNTTIKVKILCKDHGEFYQSPTNHLCGRGCPSCSNVKKLTVGDFILRSNKIHNSRYKYLNISSITNNDSYVTITCPIHGNFNQQVGSHLRGNGCKSCAMECKTSNIETKWLDLINIPKENRQYKIDKYIVDGYDSSTNTIYEFNGDFWHGNPNNFNPDSINIMLNKTFGKLHQNTLDKEANLKLMGYNVISIWESDFKCQLKSSTIKS